QVIAGSRGLDVKLERDVDDELLTVALLMLEHPVETPRPDPAHLDDVTHRRCLPVRVRRPGPTLPRSAPTASPPPHQWRRQWIARRGPEPPRLPGRRGMRS